MDAVDEYIPRAEREIDKPFLMPVEDVFTITGRGTVATGRVEQRYRLKWATRFLSWAWTDTRKTGCHRCGDVPQNCWIRLKQGDNVGILCAAWSCDQLSGAKF